MSVAAAESLRLYRRAVFSQCYQRLQEFFVTYAVEDQMPNHQALDHVYSLAYEELRRLARALLRSDRSASLTPTTLVNEAWLKLAHSPQVAETSPLHFRRIAGRAMRQVLVDAARRKHTQIRGAGQVQVTFDESLANLMPVKTLGDFLALDAALSVLGTVAPRQAKLVEGRFFGGLSWAESAASLNISEATAMREWRSARAWLAVEIRRSRQRSEAISRVGASS